MSKPVTTDGLHSDHFHVITEIEFNSPRLPPSTRRNYKFVNWERYGQIIDLHILHTDIDTANDVDVAIHNLEDAINATEAKCVPLVTTKTAVITLDPLTKGLIAERDMLRRQHQRTDNPALKQRSSVVGRIIADRVDMIRDINFANMVKRPEGKSILEARQDSEKETQTCSSSSSSNLTMMLLSQPRKKSSALANQFVQAHLLGSSPHENDVAASVHQLNHHPPTTSSEARVSSDLVTGALTTLANMKAPGFDAILNLLLKR